MRIACVRLPGADHPVDILKVDLETRPPGIVEFLLFVVYFLHYALF